MKWKKKSKKMVSLALAAALCIPPVISSGEMDMVRADSGESSVTLTNPVIDAQEGQTKWDCLYFGNYWQSQYVTQPGNRPEQGEDDVEHTDTDGTKYLVREDKTCYKYEPIKWRVLSVSEDGTDAFLMADKVLDFYAYETENSDNASWENSEIRRWLGSDFMEQAFTVEEREAILETENQNKKSPNADEDSGMEDGNNTTDQIYLLSMEEATTQAYGFTTDAEDSPTRASDATGFVLSGGTAKQETGTCYFLRTLGRTHGVASVVGGIYGNGTISDDSIHSLGVQKAGGIRPALHLDLTQTGLFTYAGQVKQDGTVISSEDTAIVPTPPTTEKEFTMDQGQIYPRNPVVNASDLNQNTWECIYFGNYYKTKITPSVLSLTGEDNMVCQDGNGGRYIARYGQGYFRYEPIKWRVLSINADGTDAFLIADQVIDAASYYSDGSVEITWEKSDIRQWLNGEFMETAFTEEEQAKIKDTVVQTPDNQWSGEAGGNDTTDKVYLPSIEEMLNVSYGFSSDEGEGDTRKIAVTEWVEAGGTPKKVTAGFVPYWLRSAGPKTGIPATVGVWGEGEIPKDASVMSNDSSASLGVRPVIHADLSDTSLWKYAGKVTPNGIVTPVITPPADTSTENDKNEDKSKPVKQEEPAVQKKPGKPVIKKLTNKKGKKVTVTLSKKVPKATGYQVAYSLKSSMKGQKKKNFRGTSITIKGLKKGKNYYFRVCAYTKKNGKTVYGEWSKKKKIKVKI